MTISRLVLILRVAGFVCMLMVALYWWPPFLHLLDPLSVGATVDAIRLWEPFRTAER